MKKLVNNPYIYFLIIAIFIVICLPFIAWSDSWSLWFNPFYNIKEIFYSRNTYNWVWWYSPNNFTSFFLRLYLSFFQIFTSNPEYIQKLSWWLYFFWGFSIVFYLIKDYILDKKIRFFVSILIFVNPLSIYFFWTKQHWTYFYIIPYIVWVIFYIKYLNTFNFKYLIYISLLLFLFGFIFNQPAYFASFFIILFILFITKLISLGFKNNKIIPLLKNNIIFFIIFILLNLVYLLPLLLWGNEILDSAIKSYSHWDVLAPFRYISQLENFSNSFFNASYWHWNLLPTIYIILQWFFISFVLYLYIKGYKKNEINTKKLLLTFTILFLFFILLLKWLNAPFVYLSEKLYSLKIMYIFRWYIDKFTIWYMVSLFFIFILLIWKFNKSKIISNIIIIFTFINLFIFSSWIWYNKEYKESSNLLIYSDIDNILKNNLDWKILNLPLVDYSFFFNKDPQYSANNPLKNILENDVVFTTGVKTYSWVDKIKKIFYKNNKDFWNKDLFMKNINLLNIEYILLNKNWYVREEWNNFYKNYDDKWIIESDKVKLVLESKYYKLFKCDFNKSGLIRSKNKIYYLKESNINYSISTFKIINSININYLDSYHPKWKIYLKNQQWFFKKPLFENSHEKIYDYANTWTISKQEIINYVDKNYWNELLKEWYPKEIENWKKDYKYYILNKDKSIDVEFTLYFKPQLYFYIWLIISVSTFLFLILWLILNSIKNKNDNKEVLTDKVEEWKQ